MNRYWHNIEYSISLFIFISVNILFILKYVGRFNIVYSIIISLLYSLAIFLFLKNIEKINIQRKLIITFVSLSIISLIVLQYSIDPYELQIDRWSAIHNFIYNLFHGIYPYSAQTHLGGYGSPFPVWQFLHIPFYLLGNVGLSFLLALCLFIHSIYKLFNYKAALFVFLLLLLSPGFLYEVTVRSDLITNFLFVCAIICYIRHINVRFEKHWLSIAILCGLMMSTRLSALIPFIIFFFSDYFSSRWKVKITFPVVILLSFIVTFLPFIFWDGNMLLYFEYSPFVLQSRQGNIYDFILFIPICIWLSLSWNNDFSKYMSTTAIFLFLFVAITFIHNMYDNSNWNELFNSAYDITYFNMSLPFVIAALITRKDFS